MNINLTDIIAVKASNDIEISAVYLENNVKVWEADTGPVAEWYGKSENYNFSQDYMSILPLEDGEIRFWLPEGNSILYSPSGNDSENDWENLTGEGYSPIETQTYYNVWSIPVTKLHPMYLKKGSTFVYGGYNRIQSQVDYYVRGNMDKSFGSSSGTYYKSFFEGDIYLLGAKYFYPFTSAVGYGYINDTLNGICMYMFKDCTSLITPPIINVD